MSYSVKECRLTLQGEGARVGRAVVLCRVAGCNLWTGRDEDRPTAACRFCDTDFVGTDGVGGGTFDGAARLARHIADCWGERATVSDARPYVVFTGGEPLLQLDRALIEACHDLGFEVGVETNGTVPCPPSIDWICVSPKSVDGLVVTQGHELKLVYPQHGVDPEAFEPLHFEHWFLQPLDDQHRKENTSRCVSYCLAHPRWRLSLQVHKIIGIP